MYCQDDEYCSAEAVGQDIQGLNLCLKHLAYSVLVQKMCNAALDKAGFSDLVPLEYRFPQDPNSHN